MASLTWMEERKREKKREMVSENKRGSERHLRSDVVNACETQLRLSLRS